MKGEIILASYTILSPTKKVNLESKLQLNMAMMKILGSDLDILKQFA